MGFETGTMSGGRVVDVKENMKYRPDVDGLRAVAVLPVVLFHSGIAGFGGGFVGVDVFFVISGYVITLRLLSDLEQGRFSIIDFYERRVRRIFPALFFMIGLTTIAASVLLLPPNFEDFSKSAVATALFVSNMYFWKFSGYFEPSALLRPLLHTWSLAVEEQYYIFMPIAMYLAYRFARAKWLLVFLPVALLSFALSVYATTTAPTANFFFLPTRAWELLLGAMLVLTPPLAPARKWLADALGFLGLGLILYAVLSYTEETPFPGVNALAPCLGAALVIYSGTRWNTTHRRHAVVEAFGGGGAPVLFALSGALADRGVPPLHHPARSHAGGIRPDHRGELRARVVLMAVHRAAVPPSRQCLSPAAAVCNGHCRDGRRDGNRTGRAWHPEDSRSGIRTSRNRP